MAAGVGDGESVVACSGNAVVAWSPKSAAQQQRTLEIKHSAQVNALGWLGKGKALAVAGEDRVVNIYSAEAKIVATAPKAHLLPPNAPSVTRLVIKGNDVVYGSSDGSIKVAKLPELKVVTLHDEPGRPITGLALTPHGRLVAASENGNVLMTQYDSGAPGRRPHYLSCRDTEARCSIAASTVAEQVVAGSCSGGINWWDAATGSAGHYIQDQDVSVHLAFQHQSAHCVFSASAAKTLKLWDCRVAEAAHQIGLLKPGSSVAAGPSAHEVAVGDAAGIVWLYDLRQPDAPTLRLPCNSGNAVSCIQWTAQQRAAADARGSRRSSGASPTSLTPNLGEVPSGLPSSGTHARRGSSAAESGVPRAPTSSATRDSPSHIGTRNNEPAASRVPPTVPEDVPSSLPNGAAPRQHTPDSVHVALPEAEMPPGSGAIAPGGDHGAATIEMMQDMLSKQQSQIQKYIDRVESRLMTRISSRAGTSDTPAYHTQHIKDHIDRGLSTMKDEVRGWLSDFQTEMVKQFHLAQEDIVDLDDRLTKRTDSLASAVEQLRHQMQAESNNRRRVANLMR